MRPWLEAELEVLEINRRDRWVISSGNLRREGEEEKEGRKKQEVERRKKEANIGDPNPRSGNGD